MVQFFFNTATFDEIEKDVKVIADATVTENYCHHCVKVTMEAALGLAGGTMGLLIGFSILSGVEIIYYVLKFFMALRIPKAERVSATN